MSEARRALVTGATGGIGSAAARALADRGWTLALTGRRTEALAAVARECASRGVVEPLALPAELTDADAVAGLARILDERWGRLDLLAHAAGDARFAPLAETDDDLWRETLAANLTSAFLVTRSLLPLLRRARAPVALYVASVAARKGFAGCAAYGAAKTGLAGFAASLREELRAAAAGGGPVRVGVLFPGATDTPLWDAQPGAWDRARMMAPDVVGRAGRRGGDAGPRRDGGAPAASRGRGPLAPRSRERAFARLGGPDLVAPPPYR